MTNIFKDGMINIAGMYVSKYKEKPEETLQLFCNTLVPLEIMNMVYGYLVADKEIVKIEALPHETKTKLWQQAKVTCNGATKEKTIKVCKCIWVINSILENENQ